MVVPPKIKKANRTNHCKRQRFRSPKTAGKKCLAFANAVADEEKLRNKVQAKSEWLHTNVA
jgi:hypothetical protein